MIGGIVLDAGALEAVARGDSRRAQVFVDYALSTLRTVALPTTVLLDVWSRTPPEGQAVLAMFPGLPVVVVDDLDLDAAVDAGAAAAEAGDSVPLDVVHAVHSATARGWPVLSGRPDDVHALAPTIAVEPIR